MDDACKLRHAAFYVAYSRKCLAHTDTVHCFVTDEVRFAPFGGGIFKSYMVEDLSMSQEEAAVFLKLANEMVQVHSRKAM
jgi:hypothetical protein